HTGNGNLIAGFRDGMFGLAIKFAVSTLQKRIDTGIGLSVRPVVDEFFDRYPLSKFGKAADMITVVMRDDQMIDRRHSRVLRRRHNSFGVTHRGWAAVSGVDEHRFSGRCNKQYGIAAFNIDDIDV